MKRLCKSVTTLFPHHQSSGRGTVLQRNDFVIPRETEELRETYGSIGNNNAPGLRGILNGALKLAVKTRHDFLETPSRCTQRKDKECFI